MTVDEAAVTPSARRVAESALAVQTWESEGGHLRQPDVVGTPAAAPSEPAVGVDRWSC